jgi:ketosteroid isomerase-like protein
LGIVGLCAVAVIAGCATSGGGMSAQDQIMKEVNAWKTAMLAKDIDGIMAPFSGSFEHYEWQDKAGAKDFISQSIDMGYLDGIEITTDAAEVKVEGDVATVYPVDVTGSFGTVTIEFTFKKEADGWKITGLDASGL